MDEKEKKEWFRKQCRDFESIHKDKVIKIDGVWYSKAELRQRRKNAVARAGILLERLLK